MISFLYLALIPKKMSEDQHLIRNVLTWKSFLVGGFHLTTLVNKFHVAIWIRGENTFIYTASSFYCPVEKEIVDGGGEEEAKEWR